MLLCTTDVDFLHAAKIGGVGKKTGLRDPSITRRVR